MRKEWLGMILAGGQGARLKLLTKKIAKLSVSAVAIALSIFHYPTAKIPGWTPSAY